MDPNAEFDTAVKQIVFEHISGSGVIDIYAEAGVEQPDLSPIDEGFIDRFRRSDRPNLQIEMLKQLLSDEITLMGRRNLVASRVLLRDARELRAALPEPLPRRRSRGRRAGGPCPATQGRAVLGLDDDVLKMIARELVESARRNATIDWSEKEQLRARMGATIRRLFTRYGYPPDKQPAAIDLVMAQARLLARAT